MCVRESVSIINVVNWINYIVSWQSNWNIRNVFPPSILSMANLNIFLWHIYYIIILSFPTEPRFLVDEFVQNMA